MQTGDHDHEALDPHAGVDEERDDEQEHRVAPDARRPERLRHEHIAKHQGPEHPAVRAEGAVDHHIDFKNVAAVPGHQRFDEIAVGHAHEAQGHERENDAVGKRNGFVDFSAP